MRRFGNVQRHRRRHRPHHGENVDILKTAPTRIATEGVKYHAVAR